MTVETLHLSARRSYPDELAAAAGDFRRSFRSARLWRVLAVNDILARYRGSLLGPFWITLTQAAFILGIGLVYARLFHMDVREYVPLLANGVIVWQLLSTTMTEGCDAFIQAQAMLKQTALPLPLFLWRVVLRNLIVFAHQAVVLVVVAVLFGYLLRVQLFWAALDLALALASVSWMALLAALVCTRFRDMPQVVAAVLQLLFFLTPVLWDPRQAPPAMAALLSLNPFFHMIEAVREPLLGRAPPLHSVGVLVALAVAGWGVAFLLFAAVRRRLVHYL